MFNFRKFYYDAFASPPLVQLSLVCGFNVLQKQFSGIQIFSNIILIFE